MPGSSWAAMSRCPSSVFVTIERVHPSRSASWSWLICARARSARTALAMAVRRSGTLVTVLARGPHRPPSEQVVPERDTAVGNGPIWMPIPLRIAGGELGVSSPGWGVDAPSFGHYIARSDLLTGQRLPVIKDHMNRITHQGTRSQAGAQQRRHGPRGKRHAARELLHQGRAPGTA